MILSGRILSAVLRRSAMEISCDSSMLAALHSSLTRLGIPCICSSALSSMVMILSSPGMKADSAFSIVVFPAPVPPPMRIVYLACTRGISILSASSVTLPRDSSRSIVTGSSGNWRMVRIGPFSAAGAMTALTLEPFSSLASTIGCRVLMTRLHLPAICCITSSSFSGDVKCFPQGESFPSRSTKMCCQPFTMISVTPGSSNSSCRTSSFRTEQNSSCRSALFCPRFRPSILPSSMIRLSISSITSSSVLSHMLSSLSIRRLLSSENASILHLLSHIISESSGGKALRPRHLPFPVHRRQENPLCLFQYILSSRSFQPCLILGKLRRGNPVLQNRHIDPAAFIQQP